MTLVAYSDFFVTLLFAYSDLFTNEIKNGEVSSRKFCLLIMEYTLSKLICLFLTTAYYNHDNN